jgi:hypothetical protein
MPMAKIKRLRADPATHMWMLDNIVPLIVGVKYFKSECKTKPPTKWLPTSSEAFAVLCLENYYNNIDDSSSNRTMVRKPKWTSDGIRAKRNQGWKKEGIEKFDEYCRKVKEDRREEGSDAVDQLYMNTKKEEMSKDDDRKRKREQTRKERETGWNAAYADDWSGDEKEKRGSTILTQDDAEDTSDDEQEVEESVQFH